MVEERYTLKNGIMIPKLGLGTWQVPPGEKTYNSVTYALRNGYRHIDTAAAYSNEGSVGQAIKDSGIPREEVFITTKLPAECKGYDITMECFEKSLNELGTDYVDLYLIHAPWPWDQWGKDCSEGNIESWKAMEEIYKSGRAKAIGVSNFEEKHLQPILDTCTIIPMVNQICFHVGHRQQAIMDVCKMLNIQVISYSPLATGKIVDDEYIGVIAKKYGVTIPQVCLRYCIQKGNVVIPKSINEDRIIANSKLDFEISQEDMDYLDNK